MKTYQEFVSEAKKCWPGYKKKGTQKLFGKTYNRCVKEGKVEWDNPKRPLQSGLTPREKNRAKRISTNVENPNRVSFGGKSWDISDKDYERYGKLKMAHDDEKGKKVPRGKRHEFGLFKVGSLTSTAPKGELRRKQKDHKNIKTKLNSKLYKNDERQKIYHHNDLKEPKESFDYELEEGYKERPIKRMMKKAMDIVNRPDYEGSSEDAWRHNQIIKHTLKKKGGGKQRKKAQHNIDKYWDRLDREDELEEGYELEESSSGERRPRGLVTTARGRGSDMTRKERSTAAIAKRAGIRGTGKFSTKDLRTPDKQYRTDIEKNPYGEFGSTKQDTFIDTYSSPRKAAVQTGIIAKREYVPGELKTKHVPSATSVRRAKDFRKSLTKAGANQRGRVHSVEIMPRDTMIDKDDPKKRIERGKNFIQAIKKMPKHLKKAGAKKGEAVMAEPAATMYGEKKDVGARKRAKLYLKLFGKKTSKVSPHTKKMVGKV